MVDATVGQYTGTRKRGQESTYFFEDPRNLPLIILLRVAVGKRENLNTVICADGGQWIIFQAYVGESCMRNTQWQCGN